MFEDGFQDSGGSFADVGVEQRSGGQSSSDGQMSGFEKVGQESKDVRENRKGALQKISDFRVEFGPGAKDILHFTSQLAVMVRAGISLTDCLESIGQQQQNKKFAAIICRIKSRIESG